jgi:16S rRNA (guanine(966)-N(2))-methyltransferase RsmD
LDRVRESLLNILSPRLAGARFADLFAGTGANGIEALSRGAVSCVFVDNCPQSLDLVRRNLGRAKLAENASVLRAELPKGLELLARGGNALDIVFADPPFEFCHYENLLDEIASCGLVVPGGVVILEHAFAEQVPDSAGVMRRVRHEKYGRTGLSFFS